MTGSKRIQILMMASAGFCVALTGCATAKVSGRAHGNATPARRPAVVYVADFDLEAANVKPSGGLPSLPKLPGPLGDLPLPGVAKDPEKVARKVVELMSATTAKELAKSGVTAKRVSPKAELPNDGWLVRGVFTEVNQGNQLTRAVVGFRAGKTELQAAVDISDLAQGPPKKFYELDATANGGKAPGAGPMIVFGPAGVAARFVIAGKDLDKDVKHAAAKIAAEVVERANGTL